MENNLKNKPWYDYLEEDLNELLLESFELLAAVPLWKDTFHDYSFVVFPAAKAYEGFLKKLFLDLHFINSDDYYGKHFRIGMALNPSLEERFRSESVYDKLTEMFQGDKKLSDDLWNAWKNCRNLLFHWFPDEKKAIDLPDAKKRIEIIITALDEAYDKCKIKLNENLKDNSN